MVGRRKQWQSEIEQVKRMQSWVFEAEEILSGRYFLQTNHNALTFGGCEEELTDEKVGRQFDEWCEGLEKLQGSNTLSELEQKNLDHFLAITVNLRPHLTKCYSLKGMPRTNNELEGYIRSLKTRYRRVSGRKNWGSYLLRYGRSAAYYEYLSRSGISEGDMRNLLSGVEPGLWQKVRQIDRAERLDQLKRFRFKRDSKSFLEGLMARWDQSLLCTT